MSNKWSNCKVTTKYANVVFPLFLSLIVSLFFFSPLAQTEEMPDVLNYDQYKELGGQEIQQFRQAPDLKKLVEEGSLPPVEERLPGNPLVMKPLRQVGHYGGTWQRFSLSEDWPFFCGMALYGDSYIRWDDDGTRLAPQLVANWTANQDKSVWTLHFRKGIKWSDGEPFTVDDALFWWEEMALNPDHSASVPDWAKSGGEAMEMVKVDEYTLKLKFAAPAPLTIAKLATMVYSSGYGSQFQVVPEHYLKQFHPDFSDEYTDFETFTEKQEWWHNPERPVLGAWMPVEEEPGKRLVLKRNPYFYAVDTEGNQLPYIDRVNIRYLADPEVFKLRITNGESDMQIRPGALTLRDVSMLKANEESGNFETLMWDSGSGTGPVYYPNRNHPDSAKRKLYRNPKFLKALSYAIDRQRINKMIYYGTGEPTTGTYSPKSAEYRRTEEGEKLYQEWKNLAIEYEPEKARSLLEEIGVVDQNGDGWRETPNGEELKLRIDTDSGANIRYTDCSEMVKGFWREVGLKAIVNPVDGSQISVMQTNATFDIRNSWEVGNGPNHLTFPHWLVPINSGRWAPLYGKWFNIQGTPEEGKELDKEPRDRTPPREKPAEGSPVDRLQKLYLKAISAPTWQERDKLVLEMARIHMEDGPFMIGTAGNYPRIGVVSDRMKNVPRKEDLTLGGFVNPWREQIASNDPPQFYIEEEEE